MDVTAVNDERLEITVQSDASLGLNGAWLDVFLPGNVADWSPRQSGALVRHIRTDWGIRIPLADITPGEESQLALVREAG